MFQKGSFSTVQDRWVGPQITSQNASFGPDMKTTHKSVSNTHFFFQSDKTWF